jgi:hypothetical protein
VCQFSVGSSDGKTRIGRKTGEFRLASPQDFRVLARIEMRKAGGSTTMNQSNG